MSNPFRQIINNVMPILAVLLFVGLFIIGLFVFSYILIIATIVGLILFSIAYIRAKLLIRKAKKQKPNDTQSGRVIEHDETSE